MNPILVIGSLNTDMETCVNRFPHAGETLLGGPLQIHCGGKGNNQAIAAAKLGASVTMLGAIGQDHFGEILLNNLRKHQVNTNHVKISQTIPTATALITRTHHDNTIIVTEGANNSLTPQDIIQATTLIEQHDIILLQQEIPLETQIKAIELAHQLNKTVIVNPAPIRPLPDDILKKISYLLPNEHEIIAFQKNSADTPETILLQTDLPIIMTWGKKGILFKDDNQQIRHIPAYPVHPLDTTGAGDTFCGAFCCFLHLGLEKALDLALRASALSVTRAGAQTGMPTLKELNAYPFQTPSLKPMTP